MTFSLSQGYLEVLISKTLENFQYLSIIDFYLIPLWSESKCCMISTTSISLDLFVAQNIIYLGECSMYIWKQCIFCCWVECSTNVNEVDCCSGLLYLYRFSVYLLYRLLRMLIFQLLIIIDLSNSPGRSISF